jgi:hypothetical protein
VLRELKENVVIGAVPDADLQAIIAPNMRYDQDEDAEIPFRLGHRLRLVGVRRSRRARIWQRDGRLRIQSSAAHPSSRTRGPRGGRSDRTIRSRAGRFCAQTTSLQQPFSAIIGVTDVGSEVCRAILSSINVLIIAVLIYSSTRS